MQQEETVSQSKAALQVKCGSCTQVINGNGLDTTEQHLAQANAHTCSSIVTCDASYEHYHKHFHASLTYPPQLHISIKQTMNPSCTHAVPAQILPQLAERQQFRCPYCHIIQNVNLSPEVANQIIIGQQQDQHKRPIARQPQQPNDWHSHINSLGSAHHDTSALHQLVNGASGHYHAPVGCFCLACHFVHDSPSAVYKPCVCKLQHA